MPAKKIGKLAAMGFLGSVLCAGLLFLENAADGQGKKPPLFMEQPDPATTSSGLHSAVRLVGDPKTTSMIEACQENIEKKQWDTALNALQLNILDRDGDSYVKLREKGGKAERWTSAKFEANNLIGKLPDEGLDAYELRYGHTAKDMLDEAKKKGDRDQVAKVAQRYMHTRAGVEANDLLATYFLDRGEYFVAALLLEKIMAMNPERSKISDLTLFKAALAYTRTGDTKRFNEAWNQLTPRLEARNGLKIGDDVVTVAQLKEFLKENKVRVQFASVFDWPTIRGNPANNAQANGSQPALDYTMFPARSTILDGGESVVKASQVLEAAIKEQRDVVGGPVMSGFFPIVANKTVIFRTHKDIHAVSLFPTKDSRGNEIPAGTTVWRGECDNSLVNVLSNAKLSATLGSFLAQFGSVPGYRSLVYENSLIGTISFDPGSRLVYAVDDLAIPAAPNMLMALNTQQGAGLKSRVFENLLAAFDVATGKLVWRLGKGPVAVEADGGDETPNPFAGSHFLSVPISVGGKLYVLNEGNSNDKNPGVGGDAELRLVCIDPDPVKAKANKGQPVLVRTATGEPVKVIGTISQLSRFTHDPVRRTNAAHMAYGEGIIVCTTNAGEVLGVDVLSRGLAWSYPYREQMPASQVMPGGPGIGNPGGGMPRMASLPLPTCKSSPPVIQDGKVVFMAPDATSIHCISLRDGTHLWKKKYQEGDLFLGGVFNGKVLVVGRSSVRLLSLHDKGNQLWQESTLGMPSGQGVASKNVYFLPLRKSDGRSEIVAFDLDRQMVKSRNPAVSSRDDVGNLVFYEGMVLSETPQSLVAYPELKVQLEIADKEVKANPNNAVSLFKRGKWLLADGRVQPAVDDIRVALKTGLPADLKAEARRKLFQALTDLMQTNFKENAKYVAEYREVCDVPEDAEEQEERMAKFFRTVAQGYESVGNLVEAFQMYREFGALPSIRKDAVISVDDPSHKVPTNVWLRGRIANMMLNARAADRQPLENKIAEEWKVEKAKKDLHAIRTFVDMFDVPVGVGREARLHLAETIIERDERAAFLEAELNLQQLRGSAYFRDDNVSARALAGLGKLEEKRASADSMKLAAMYYRELRRLYPKEPLADGKNGTQLLDELTTDPRYLPLLEEPGPLWTNEKIGYRDLQNVRPGQQGFIFQPEGDLTPLMKQTRLLLDSNSLPPKLHCYNFATNTLRWTLDMGTPQFNQQVFQVLYSSAQPGGKYNPNARFRFFQVRGNLAVVQVGTVAYCLDMDGGKVLWQHSLFEGPANPNMSLNSVHTDYEGNLEFGFRNFNNQITTMHAGHVGAVQASYVALMTPRGLLVVDPLRGTPLWRKSDIPMQTRVFGDDQCLFTVDDAAGNGGVGRAYQAIDGANKNVADFGALYQGRLRIAGRNLLVNVEAGNGRVLKLHDVIAGKDLWSVPFPARSVPLATEDPSITGMIEPNGKATVLDAETGKVVFQSSLVQGSVKDDDIAGLEEPLLLQDRDRYYFCLNQPVKAADGILHNNFGNGLRCRTVNGWVLSFFREDGQHLAGGKSVQHKKGDFDWCSPVKIENQLVVVEQFENLPVLLFSARYLVGQNWSSYTQSLHRSTGKRVYWSGARAGSHFAPYGTFLIDTKEGTINLIGLTGNNLTVQLFVDDGRNRPLPPGAEAALPGRGGDVAELIVMPGGFGPGAGGFGPGGFGGPGMNPGFGNPPIFNPPPSVIVPPPPPRR